MQPASVWPRPLPTRPRPRSCESSRPRRFFGLVFAWWGIEGRAPQWSLPADPQEEAGWSDFEIKTIRFPGHPQETTENSVDLGHLRYVHGYGNVDRPGRMSVDGPCLESRFDFRRIRTIAKIATMTFDLSAVTRIFGLGVGMSLVVMLTLVPAGRTIIDRRREARGMLKPAHPIVNALPGIERLAGLLGRSVTRWPAPYILVVLAVTVGLGIATPGLKSEFSIRDVLPRGGTVLADMETLEAAVGGSTEVTNVLIKAEATETRTLLNVRDLTTAFQNEARRPSTAAGPIQTSYELLLRDWTTDSGEPGDKYDPELAALFREASAGVQLDPALMQEVLDKLGARDPAVARVLVNNPQGIDAMLLQFPSYGGDPTQTKEIQRELEELWAGDDDAITATSESIISITVTDSVTARQTEAVATTIAAALTVLAVFFWVTLRQPALAIVAVGPIVLVLICVLGTMALLGIPYTHHHVNHHGALDRDRRGLHHPCDSSLPGGVRPPAQPGGSGGPDARDHWVGAVGLCTDDRARAGSAGGLAVGWAQQFGITAAITIAYSLIVAIVLVPPAMTVWGAYQNMRLRSMVEREWRELDVAIDEVHRRYEQKQESS